jgi:ArsR family transcriptional regulator, cadmium/lead-responsive transcriptional repressor
MSTTQTRPEDLRTKLELSAKLFRGFADPSRLTILAALQEGERCVSELIEATGLTQSNVSGHLSCLKDCGLVASRQEGRFVYYRLADPEVSLMLSGAEMLLSRLADRIAACVNYALPQETIEKGRPR